MTQINNQKCLIINNKCGIKSYLLLMTNLNLRQRTAYHNKSHQIFMFTISIICLIAYMLNSLEFLQIRINKLLLLKPKGQTHNSDQTSIKYNILMSLIKNQNYHQAQSKASHIALETSLQIRKACLQSNTQNLPLQSSSSYLQQINRINSNINYLKPHANPSHITNKATLLNSNHNNFQKGAGSISNETKKINANTVSSYSKFYSTKIKTQNQETIQSKNYCSKIINLNNRDHIRKSNYSHTVASSSVGKIVKNKPARKITTKVQRDDNQHECHQPYQNRNQHQNLTSAANLYIGRHKKLALQNKAIDEILRKRMLNITESLSCSKNTQSKYMSLANSKIGLNSFLYSENSCYANKENGITDKRRHQFDQKYKDMVKQYGIKKKLLNQQLGCFRVTNNCKEKQNLNQLDYHAEVGRIRKKKLDQTDTAKNPLQQTYNQRSKSLKDKLNYKDIKFYQENPIEQSFNYHNLQSNLGNPKKLDNKQQNLVEKFKLYQERCNTYEQLSKKTVQTDQKYQSRLKHNNHGFSNQKKLFKENQVSKKDNFQKLNKQLTLSEKSKNKRNTALATTDFFNLVKKQIQKDQEVRILKHYARQCQKQKQEIYRILKDQHQMPEQLLRQCLRLSDEEYDPFLVVKQIQFSQLANRLASAVKISEQFWDKFLYKSLKRNEAQEAFRMLNFDKDQGQIDFKVFTRQMSFNLKSNKIVRSRDLYRIYQRIISNSLPIHEIDHREQQFKNEKKEQSYSLSKSTFLKTFQKDN